MEDPVAFLPGRLSNATYRQRCKATTETALGKLYGCTDFINHQKRNAPNANASLPRSTWSPSLWTLSMALVITLLGLHLSGITGIGSPWGLAPTHMTTVPYIREAATGRTTISSPTPIPRDKQAVKTSDNSGILTATSCVHKTLKDSRSTSPASGDQQPELSTAPLSDTANSMLPLSAASAALILKGSAVPKELTAPASATTVPVQSVTPPFSSNRVPCPASITASESAAQQMQQSTLCTATLSPPPIGIGSMATTTGHTSTITGPWSTATGPLSESSEPLAHFTATPPSSHCGALDRQPFVPLNFSHSNACNASLNSNVFPVMSQDTCHEAASAGNRVCQHEARDAQSASQPTGNQTQIMSALQACRCSMSQLLGFKAWVEPHGCDSIYGQEKAPPWKCWALYILLLIWFLVCLVTWGAYTKTPQHVMKMWRHMVSIVQGIRSVHRGFLHLVKLSWRCFKVVWTQADNLRIEALSGHHTADQQIAPSNWATSQCAEAKTSKGTQREQQMFVNTEVEADHAERVSKLQTQHYTKLAADLVAANTRLKATYDKRISELQMQHSSELAAELLATKSKLKAAHDKRIKELEMQHQSELAEAEQHLSDFVDDFEEMKRHRDYYEGALLETERSMDEMRSVCKALGSERSMHEAALAAALKVIDAQEEAYLFDSPETRYTRHRARSAADRQAPASHFSTPSDSAYKPLQISWYSEGSAPGETLNKPKSPAARRALTFDLSARVSSRLVRSARSACKTPAEQGKRARTATAASPLWHAHTGGRAAYDGLWPDEEEDQLRFDSSNEHSQSLRGCPSPASPQVCATGPKDHAKATEAVTSASHSIPFRLSERSKQLLGKYSDNSASAGSEYRTGACYKTPVKNLKTVLASGSPAISHIGAEKDLTAFILDTPGTAVPGTVRSNDLFEG